MAARGCWWSSRCGRSAAKTDRRDANALSELLWVNRDRLLRQEIESKGYGPCLCILITNRWKNNDLQRKRARRSMDATSEGRAAGHGGRRAEHPF